MKYPKLDLGKIEAMVNKLGGMEGVQEFLSGKTIVISKEKTVPFEQVFKFITEIQAYLQGKFQKAEIDLNLVTVCNNKELPSFRGSSINDVSGSSLDIEFKNKQGHFLVIHLFNRNSFSLTFDTYQSTSIYPMERFDDKKFLEGIKDFFNKRHHGNEEARKAAFKFIDKFRK